MRFDQLDAQTLAQLGTAEAQEAARALVQGQQVQHGYHQPDRLQAVVWDEDILPVEVAIKDDQLSFQCSCSQAEKNEVCSHVLAVLWNWIEDPGRFLNHLELKERLKKYSRKDLVEIILDLADRVPEVRPALKEEELGLEEILESIDHVMAEVATESLDPAEAEDKLRRAQAWADRLAQTGQLAEARTIYFYILDNVLGLEEKLKRDHLFTRELKEELFEEYCQFIHEDRHLEKDLVQHELEQLANRAAVSRGDLDISEMRQQFLGAG